MKTSLSRGAHWSTCITVVTALCFESGVAYAQTKPLPSWFDSSTKTAIINFVTRVTTPGPDFIPASERIATFDGDGTLWPEQPIDFQFAFALDRLRSLAVHHPEWNDKQFFKTALNGDMQALAPTGAKGFAEIIVSTHTGMTTEAFAAAVSEWLVKARHPANRRPYTELAFQPMVELIDFLRENGFKTFIVSRGNVEFVRVFAEKVYGIPPEQVIGTTFVNKFELDARERPVLLREPKVEFVEEGSGKPVSIQKFIGRRPILAVGNSDGDLEMLQWVAAGNRTNFVALVHHTDAAREWAYDRLSHVGRLDKALDEAFRRKWIVIDMKLDWKVVFPAARTVKANEPAR